MTGYTVGTGNAEYQGLYPETKAVQIIAKIWSRRNAQTPLLKAMLDVQQRYDGGVDGTAMVIPLPDVEGSPSLPKSTPLLLARAIDEVALNATSQTFNLTCPALDPTKARGVRSREWADIRRMALDATYQRNYFPLHLRRAYRQLAGYGTFVMMVAPSRWGDVEVSLKEVLAAYPDPKAPEDLSPPQDIAFLYDRSQSWLRAQWPACRVEVGGPIPPPGTGFIDRLWTVFEWWDADECVIGILGPKYPTNESGQFVQGNILSSQWMVLEWYQNRLGYCPAIAPRRMSMSRVAAQVAQLLGAIDLQDKLMALEIVAAEKAIFPDRYVIAREGREPRVVGSNWVDGRQGGTNLLEDVEKVGELHGSPDPAIQHLQDRLERNVTTSAGLVPQQVGETYGALRTGRGIDTLTGIALDPRVKEAHEIMEYGLQAIGKMVLDTYRVYHGAKTFSMMAGRNTGVRMVTFTPNVHFETAEHRAWYAIPGLNEQQLTVALGQMKNLRALSLQSLRLLHPWIDDPEAEGDKVMAEDLDDAMLQGIIRSAITQAATTPGLSPAVMIAARVRRYVRDGFDVGEALLKANTDMQAMQAASAPPPDEGQVAAPEVMPGVMGTPHPGGAPAALPPGAAGGLPPGPVAPVPPAQAGLPAMLAALQANPRPEPAIPMTAGR